MESKTYVFGNEGSTSNNGMLGLLAPLLQKQGVDPNVLLAMKGNNGFGGEGGWFMWVIFLFFLMGWGGGWGGFGNNGRGGLANEINNDYGRGLLMDAIGGNRNALSNLATQLNCTEGQIQSAISALTSQVQSVGNQVGMSGIQTINALQQGNMQIAQQIANCCCENRLAICQQTGTLQNAINNVATGQERGFSNVAYETQRQTCDLHNAIKDSTQTIIDRGLTYSNLSERRSVLAIGECESDCSIINTICHELLHVVAHICEQDGIDMLSEEPCYMMGSLCERFFDVSSVNNVN